MEQHEREYLVAKLLSGATFFKLGNTRYKIINPNPDQMLLAEEIAREAVLEASFKQLLTEKEAEQYLHDKGIWTYEQEKAFKESEKLIDDMKVELFQTISNKKTGEKYKDEAALKAANIPEEDV